MTPEEIFLAHEQYIRRAIRRTCRYHHLRQEDAEEFEGRAIVKFIEDDYAVIRKYQGRSKIETYFGTVIVNLLKDFMNYLWGKRRPSEEARRLGPVAMLLDIYLNWERYPFDQACQILRINHHVELSVEELEKLAARIPRRIPRPQADGDESLVNLPAPDGSADSRIVRQERAAEKRKAFEALKQALAVLSPEDRVMAHLRIQHSIADIARIQNRDQKPLYRHFDRIFKTLRQELERRGVRKEDVSDLLDGEGEEFPDETE
jgi:RNA polymerase sigma factor (sigma-70 family)